MDKTTWLQLSQEKRKEKLNELLTKLVEIDKVQAEHAKSSSKPLPTQRFSIEQQVLKIISWEKEEHDED